MTGFFYKLSCFGHNVYCNLMFASTVTDSRARSPVPAGCSGPALLLRGDAQQREALRPHQQGLPAPGTPGAEFIDFLRELKPT